MKVNVIEGGEYLCSIACRHEFRNFVHAGAVVYMAVSVDDLHCSDIPFVGTCMGYNKLSSLVSTRTGKVI